MTNKELIAACKARHIQGFSGCNKEQLIDLLDGLCTNPAKRAKPSAPATIDAAAAAAAAAEWIGNQEGPSLMRDYLVGAIMDPKQHRDIGKVLANVAEIHVNKWLSEQSGRTIHTVVGEPYDGETRDDKPKVRNQVKFRMDAWHFETTRRNSQKNAETNSTGHVAYRADEFDMVAIFKPGPHFGITGSSIRCIPASALVNPDKPGQLVTGINASTRKLYDSDEKTAEVIKLLYG
jgi:hypothetical protein